MTGEGGYMSIPVTEFEMLHQRASQLQVALENRERQQSVLRAALERIRDTCGAVCNKFELCDHEACASSYRAWAYADAALKGMTPEQADKATTG